jgi:hypothetical protein
VIVPVVFLLLSATRIETQGPYYDELHQAPAAFMLVGKPPYIFIHAWWKNIPLLTMPYSGAAKSIIFGLWMRWTGLTFSLGSWRLFGIILLMTGLICFFMNASSSFTAVSFLLFAGLFLSDVTVLLTTRHDWGPTALSMGLRLAWLGLWIKVDSERPIRPADAFFFGLLPAFSAYEKLSNVVLLVILALVVCFSGNERYWKHKLPIIAGLLVGFGPLALVNVINPGISVEFGLNSLHSTHFTNSFYPTLTFLSRFVALGAGNEVRTFILDYPVPSVMQRAEVNLMVPLLLAATIVSVIYWRRQIYARLMLLSVSGYLLTGIVTWMLPQVTSVHHWIVATPFQYIAIALLPVTLKKIGVSTQLRTWYRGTLLTVSVLLSCLLLVRAFNLWDTEVALTKEMASARWDPSYTSVARFAVKHQNDANFILADWGFATSIYAFSNGSFPVAEPFWSYRDPSELLSVLRQRPGKPVYVLSRRLEEPVNPSTTASIIRDVTQIAGGHEMPVDPEIAALRSVRVLKFRYPG